MWIQRHLRLSPQPRGFHLITREVVDALPELEELRVGMLHLLIQHTSASLALNENASPDVRRDFETWFDQAVPDGRRLLVAHARGRRRHARPHQVRAAGLDADACRSWAGAWRSAPGRAIYLCEHRDHGGSRVIIATAWGETG